MGGRGTRSPQAIAVGLMGLAAALAAGVEAGAESGGADWMEQEIPAKGGRLDLPDGLRLDVLPESPDRGAARTVKVRTAKAIPGRAIHRSFVPCGASVEAGPGTSATVEVSLPAAQMGAREGLRRVLAVELHRPYRLPPFDPTASPTRAAGRETSAWVLVDTAPRDGGATVAARAGLVEGRRLQLGWVPQRLAPPAARVPVALGAGDASLCVGRRGAVLELSAGERAAVAPARGASGRDCDDVVLRRVRSPFVPRLPRSAFAPVGPTFALEGLGISGLRDPGRVSLSVPLSGRPPRGRILVIAVERIVNEGECPLGDRGCAARWVSSGQLLVEAYLGEDGRAHARLPVHEQVGLRDGRLRFGWLRADSEGVDVIAAPRRVARAAGDGASSR